MDITVESQQEVEQLIIENDAKTFTQIELERHVAPVKELLDEMRLHDNISIETMQGLTIWLEASDIDIDKATQYLKLES